MLLQKIKDNKELYTLFLATMLTLATMYLPQPLLSSIQKSFPSHSDAHIALLMTVVFVPLSIAPLLYGAVLSAFSTKKVLLCSVALLLCSSLGLFVSEQFEIILFFRLIQGLVVPAMLTSLMAHLSAQYDGSTLQHIMATYIAATILGGLIGRIFSGIIASASSWQTPFMVLAVALAILLYFVSSLEEQPKTTFTKFSIAEFHDIVHTKGIKRLLFIESMCFFVFVALATYLPFFLTQIDNTISEWRIGLMYLGYGMGIIVALKSGKIIAYVGGSVRSIRLGVLIFGISLALFLVPNVYFIFAAMFLLCTGQFLEHSITPGLVNRICPYNRNAVNGLYLSIYYLGGALGSYLPGYIFEYFGWQYLIAFLACLLLAALIASLGLEKHTPQQ